MSIIAGVGGIAKTLSVMCAGIGGVAKEIEVAAGIGGVRKTLITTDFVPDTWTGPTLNFDLSVAEYGSANAEQSAYGSHTFVGGTYTVSMTGSCTSISNYGGYDPYLTIVTAQVSMTGSSYPQKVLDGVTGSLNDTKTSVTIPAGNQNIYIWAMIQTYDDGEGYTAAGAAAGSVTVTFTKTA